METIVSVCRALACGPRLRLLHPLSLASELRVGELVGRSGLAEDVVSAHLRVLAGAGLVERRRSGAKVYYRLASELPGLFRPTRLVHRAFAEPLWAVRGWDEEGLLHLRSVELGDMGQEVQRVLDVLFDAATAFTNVRRVQVTKLLHEMGICNEEGIRADLSMSRAACYRHVDKLERRGYIRERQRGLWALASRHRTPFHRGLFLLVVRRLQALR